MLAQSLRTAFLVMPHGKSRINCAFDPPFCFWLCSRARPQPTLFPGSLKEPGDEVGPQLGPRRNRALVSITIFPANGRIREEGVGRGEGEVSWIVPSATWGLEPCRGRGWRGILQKCSCISSHWNFKISLGEQAPWTPQLTNAYRVMFSPY